jgi:hypothetical protein
MRAMLEHINGGSRADGWQRFADGGYVGSSVASTATGSRGGDTLNVELHGNGQSSVGGGGFSPADVASLKQLLGGWMDKRLAERMGGQGGYAYQMRYGQIR